MARTSKTTKFLKECMADALLKLMQAQPIERISVQQITDLAGVGRATWFRNFSSKGEALTFKLVCEWQRLVNENNLQGSPILVHQNAYYFFLFISKMRNNLDAIYRAERQGAVYDAFYEIISPEIGEEKEERYAKQFYAYGLFGLIDEWIKKGYRESPEEMANIFRKIRRLEE